MQRFRAQGRSLVASPGVLHMASAPGGQCLGPRWALSALCRPVCAAREPLRAQGCSVGGYTSHRFWPGAQFLRAHVGSAC
eukprot:632989-Pyramimonas_sp.AAC.1